MIKPGKSVPQILPLETQLRIVETMYSMGFIRETNYVHAKLIYDYSLMIRENTLSNSAIIEKLSEKYFTSPKNVEFIIYQKELGCFKPPVVPVIVNSQKL